MLLTLLYFFQELVKLLIWIILHWQSLELFAASTPEIFVFRFVWTVVCWVSSEVADITPNVSTAT